MITEDCAGVYIAVAGERCENYFRARKYFEPEAAGGSRAPPFAAELLGRRGGGCFGIVKGWGRGFAFAALRSGHAVRRCCS